MKKLLPCLLAAVLLYSGCSKDHIVNPAKNSFKISITTSLGAVTNSTWQQVLGGEALITFTPVNNDSVSTSVVTDSLNLKEAGTYSRSIFGGTYNISLNTKSIAVADTFIRFTSVANNLTINHDGAISLPAITTDGVITINKSLIDTTVVPTFIPSGSTAPLNFGKANGYYFIYVSDNTTGIVSFVEATSGYTYLKQLTISAMNQYDLAPILNVNALNVRLHPFHLFINTQHNL